MAIYLEIIYSLLCKNNISIFAIITGTIVTFLLFMLKEKHYRIKVTIESLILVIFIIYYIYFNLYGMQLNIYNFFNAFKAKEFAMVLFTKINYLKVFLFFIPIPFMFYFKKVKYHSILYNKKIILLTCVALYIINYSFIFIDNNGLYNKYNLYFKIQNNDINFKEFGLITSVKLDMMKYFTKFKNDNVSSYNFSASCESDEICEINNYIKSIEPTEKNVFTGLFKGKNLILFLAESFYPLGVNKEITPTLYKLVNDGFYFSNYYNPTFQVSTADSQYIYDNSLYPADNTWSMTKIVGNTIQYSYPKVLKNYSSYSYHNYTYNYYSRDKYMKTLGYQTYLACGNGLEKRMNCNNKQNSDLEMIQATINDYINDDNFLVYYTTMSGHANYDSSSPMVKKNYNAVKDLKYSLNVKNYISTQVELNNALDYLLNELDKNGKLDDTLIVLIGDHPPNALTYEEIIESRNDIKYEEFDYYKSNLIIYNNQIKKQVIDKPCSTIDVLPTILNLFDIKYDSRLLMGKDIFSKSNGLVIFQNRNFIYNDLFYNSNTDKIVSGKTKNEDLETLKEKVYLKYRYSRLILENNYYKYLINKVD